MIDSIRTCLKLSLVALVCLASSTSFGQLSFEPSWQPPTYETVRRQVFDWIDNVPLDPILAQEGRSLWPSVPLREMGGAALLDSVVETAAIMYPPVGNLMAQCNQHSTQPLLPDISWLMSREYPDFVQNNVRLYLARWLNQHARYDDALALLEDVHVQEVVDPASLLFCRMVAHHQLVEPDRSRAALIELMGHEHSRPTG